MIFEDPGRVHRGNGVSPEVRDSCAEQCWPAQTLPESSTGIAL